MLHLSLSQCNAEECTEEKDEEKTSVSIRKITTVKPSDTAEFELDNR